jgi:hypothetical protein
MNNLIYFYVTIVTYTLFELLPPLNGVVSTYFGYGKLVRYSLALHNSMFFNICEHIDSTIDLDSFVILSINKVIPLYVSFRI